MPLNQYFNSKEIKKTFAAHSSFIIPKPEWHYKNRLKLYALADIAFGGPSEMRAQAFYDLFTHLSAKWQLIRPAKHFMAWQDIYTLLTKDCLSCSKSNQINLTNIHTYPEAKGQILKCLITLRNIKTLPLKTPSIMAISKLLHFYNPKLFPIYDGKFVERGILKTFSADWKNFTTYPKISDLNLQKYLKYIYFGNHLIKGQNKLIKREFRKHLKTHAVDLYSDKLQNYYSLSFEFLALGAYYKKQNGNNN